MIVVELWFRFYFWAASQPTFVQVAIGALLAWAIVIVLNILVGLIVSAVRKPIP